MRHFDIARVQGIADEIPMRLEQHATLLARTDDPLFRDLVELSRKWWLIWLAAGLHDVSRNVEADAMEEAFCERLAELEEAMLKRGGIVGCERFISWAAAEISDYVEPMVEWCTAWEAAERLEPEVQRAERRERKERAALELMRRHAAGVEEQ